MIKASGVFISCLLLLLFSSCSKYEIAKRHYNKGFHIAKVGEVLQPERVNNKATELTGSNKLVYSANLSHRYGLPRVIDMPIAQNIIETEGTPRVIPTKKAFSITENSSFENTAQVITSSSDVPSGQSPQGAIALVIIIILLIAGGGLLLVSLTIGAILLILGLLFLIFRIIL